MLGAILLMGMLQQNLNSITKAAEKQQKMAVSCKRRKRYLFHSLVAVSFFADV